MMLSLISRTNKQQLAVIFAFPLAVITTCAHPSEANAQIDQSKQTAERRIKVVNDEFASVRIHNDAVDLLDKTGYLPVCASGPRLIGRQLDLAPDSSFEAPLRRIMRCRRALDDISAEMYDIEKKMFNSYDGITIPFDQPLANQLGHVRTRFDFARADMAKAIVRNATMTGADCSSPQSLSEIAADVNNLLLALRQGIQDNDLYVIRQQVYQASINTSRARVRSDICATKELDDVARSWRTGLANSMTLTQRISPKATIAAACRSLVSSHYPTEACQYRVLNPTVEYTIHQALVAGRSK